MADAASLIRFVPLHCFCPTKLNHYELFRPKNIERGGEEKSLCQINKKMLVKLIDGGEKNIPNTE